MVCFFLQFRGCLVWLVFPRAARAAGQRALAASEILGGRQLIEPDDPGLTGRDCFDAARCRENCRCVGFMVATLCFRWRVSSTVLLFLVPYFFGCGGVGASVWLITATRCRFDGRLSSARRERFNRIVSRWALVEG